MDLPLAISAFIAGMLMFLAPCTLPLVPGYIGFISGATTEQLLRRDPKIKRKVLVNGLLYVTGFSAIFILFGILFGLGGQSLLQYREWFSRIGGIVVILFGLYMIFAKRLPLFTKEFRYNPLRHLEPGKPISSLLFGATFAFGWTPCVGPILGTVLLLASTTATIWKGALLLLVFSLGMAIPFLLIAVSMGAATELIKKYRKTLRLISVIGGVFIVILGALLLFDAFDEWLRLAYRLFSPVQYEKLLDYL